MHHTRLCKNERLSRQKKGKQNRSRTREPAAVKIVVFVTRRGKSALGTKLNGGPGSERSIPPNLAQNSLVVVENKHADKGTDSRDGPIMLSLFTNMQIYKYAQEKYLYFRKQSNFSMTISQSFRSVKQPVETRKEQKAAFSPIKIRLVNKKIRRRRQKWNW